MLDRVTIITTTYYPDTKAGRNRYSRACECISSWLNNIIFDGIVMTHISDDGSEIKIKYDSRQYRMGVGASLNNGFWEVFKYTDVAMYVVDDWRLNEKLDITPWVNMLRNNKDIGMVRLGPPHPDLTGIIKMFNEGFAIVLDRHNYAYAMRPALYHRRFFESYGWFEEEICCWECERIYNEHFCRTEGPKIVYALPVCWEHIDTLALGQLEPKGAV